MIESATKTLSVLEDFASSVSLVDDLAPSESTLHVSVSVDGANHVVNVSGELDVRTRQLVEQACLAGHDLAVVVEMSELTFMDCCGYAGLIGIRRALLASGRLADVDQPGRATGTAVGVAGGRPSRCDRSRRHGVTMPESPSRLVTGCATLSHGRNRTPVQTMRGLAFQCLDGDRGQ